MNQIEQAALDVYAEFPKGYFLENLAVRADGSILVSAMNKKELWCIPSPGDPLPLRPILVHTFDLMTFNMIEAEPDIFYVTVSDVYDTRESKLYRLDLRAWKPGEKIEPICVLHFPDPKVGMNGSCLVAPHVLLAGGATDLADRRQAGAGAHLAAARQHEKPARRKETGAARRQRRAFRQTLRLCVLHVHLSAVDDARGCWRGDP